MVSAHGAAGVTGCGLRETPGLRQNMREMSKVIFWTGGVANHSYISQQYEGGNVRRHVSSEPIVIRVVALHAVNLPYSSFFLSGMKESFSMLPMILPGSIQGLLNQAHSFSFCVPFFFSSNCSHELVH